MPNPYKKPLFSVEKLVKDLTLRLFVTKGFRKDNNNSFCNLLWSYLWVYYTARGRILRQLNSVLSCSLGCFYFSCTALRMEKGCAGSMAGVARELTR